MIQHYFQKITFFTLLSFCPFFLFSQKGPGGVGNTDGSTSLKLWLNASAGTSTTSNGVGVSAWADQSGNSYSADQATGSNQPTYVSSSVNGQPALNFDGSNDFMVIPTFPLFTTSSSPVSMFVVFNPSNVSSQRFVVHHPQTNCSNNLELGYHTGYGSTSNWGLHRGCGIAAVVESAASTSYNIMSLQILSSGSTPSNVQFRKNGADQTETNNGSGWANAGSYGTASRKLIIGARDDNNINNYNGFHIGTMAEVISYNATLNLAQTTLVENYLNAKYDISISNDKYAQPSASTYILGVSGIGKESDGSNTTSSSSGLALTNSTFLVDNGDYMITGYNSTATTTVTADLPSGFDNRWERDWFLDKTDVSTNDGNVTFTFDFSEMGIGGTPVGSYQILYRAAGSGNYSAVTGSSSISGDQVAFTIDGSLIADGYYTLGKVTSQNALSFDGSTDKVTIPASTAYNVTAFSLECWLTSSLFSTTSQMSVISHGPNGGNTNYYQLYFSNNQLVLFVNDAVGTNHWLVATNANLGISNGNTYHIAITYAGNGGVMNIYVNGVKKYTSAVITWNLNTTAGYGLNIGQYNNSFFFNGKMDEVRLWNDVRTYDEILSNMHATLAGNESGLVAYFDFNQGTAGGSNATETSLIDKTSNANHGALGTFNLTGATSNWVASDAKITDATTALNYAGAGNALTFDGSNDNVVCAVNYTATHTVEGWINVSSYANQPQIVMFGGTSSLDDVQLRILTTGKILYGMYAGVWEDVVGNVVISTNTWYHVAAVKNGTTISIYVNGILDGSGTITGSPSGQNRIGIGSGYYNGASVATYFAGQIDEIRVWDDARTIAEIRTNMFNRLKGDEANLVAYYTFDEISGTTLTDKTGNGHTGTLGNFTGTYWTSAAAREPAKAVVTGGNWNTASTWLRGAIPNAATQDVYILNNTTLDTDVSARLLNITTDDTLSISDTKSFTAASHILNDGVITINNTGALIQGTSSSLGNNGTFRVNKSGTEATGALRYNFWGSPITAANVSLLGAFGGNRYWYDPAAATGDLAAGWQAASGTMVVGRGYIATNSGDVTFTGTVNNGTLTYAATTATFASANIENVIGNPYPSGLDLTSFAAANVSASQLTSSFYFWDDKGTAGNYGTDGYATFNSSTATWTAAGFSGSSSTPNNNIIASGQGFVVVPGASAPASFDVTFTNSMRAANTSVFYRAGADRERFWVQLTKDSTHFSEMAVVVNTDATENYDEQYDSKRLDASTTVTSINAYYNNTFVVIKSLPAFSTRKQVPLSINISEDGLYTFTVSKSDNVDGMKIFLFDNVTGMAHLISNNTEHLQLLTAGSYFDRFYLVFEEVENAGTKVEEVHTIEYSLTPCEIILTNVVEPITYEIYSVNGQLLEQEKLSTSAIDLSSYSTGIYLVTLKSASTTETIKFARH